MTLRKPLLLATLAATVALGTFSTRAEAGDPIAGAVVGTAIGAAVGGPIGAAVGAVLGTAIASDPYYYHRGRDRYYDRPSRYERGYDRGYEGRYDRGYSTPPVRYYEPAPRYEPRAYREARYEPRYYDAPRYESRYEPRSRYYDDRRW